ncbi:hypothetical protein NGA_0683900, partial [Nannochloropsis gaditana CCMP526]|uniref:uncharacterized protein n=1 Tax=Nannochloropsis gaditana (strain CCMP526) TaxID=1093141 RepID=UPI00029F6312
MLVQNEEKGRYCCAPPQGFEPGRVLLEEEAYIWGNGHAEWCLECDTPSHASPACPRIRASYPPSIVPLLPAIENWMMKDLERVQSLDRARAWIKIAAFQAAEEEILGAESEDEGSDEDEERGDRRKEEKEEEEGEEKGGKEGER